VHETKCATSSKSEVQKRPGQGKENCHTISNKTAKPEREIVKKTTILQDMYRNTTSHISQLFIVKLRTFLQKDKYRKHTSSYFNSNGLADDISCFKKNTWQLLNC